MGLQPNQRHCSVLQDGVRAGSQALERRGSGGPAGRHADRRAAAWQVAEDQKGERRPRGSQNPVSGGRGDSRQGMAWSLSALPCARCRGRGERELQRHSLCLGRLTLGEEGKHTVTIG